jgi:hypothetical protein
MSGTVYYGDNLILMNCESGRLLVIAGDNQLDRFMIEVKAGSPSRKAPMNHIWKIVPAEGSQKALGEPVTSGDLISLQAVDSKENSRFLSINKGDDPTDKRSLVADMAPDVELAAWMIAGVTQIMKSNQGFVADPSGAFMDELQYDDNYITLSNPARSENLCVEGVNIETVSTEIEGAACWWNVLRTTALQF